MGTNVFSRDWDALIILDACRVDALRQVAPEYDFLEEVSSMWSVGSATAEWTAKTFHPRHAGAIRQTAYVSANWYTKSVLIDRVFPPIDDVLPFDFSRWNVLDASELVALEGVWEWDGGYDSRLHTVPAGYVTDRAIVRGRRERHDRLMVHYTQPHIPYVGRAAGTDRQLCRHELDPWPAFRQGELAREELRDLYVDNLRYVLDQVTVLLDNIDADRVVLTADHGEAFGEWGAFSHPLGFPHPAVKRVPWVETSAQDTGTHTPEFQASDDAIKVEQEQFLADLGYL